MHTLLLITSAFLAYLLGSIPSSVWLGKIFYGKDVRDFGSGNAGTVNSLRTFGWKIGVSVLLIDVSKGVLATLLPLFFGLYETSSNAMINAQIFTGSLAIVGHIFPIFAGFKGGKGVATIFGILLVLSPLYTLVSIGVFLLTIVITKISSISSLLAVSCFSMLQWFVSDSSSMVLKVFSLCLVVLLFTTHIANIKRLLRGEENKLFSTRERK